VGGMVLPSQVKLWSRDDDDQTDDREGERDDQTDVPGPGRSSHAYGPSTTETAVTTNALRHWITN